MKILRKVASGTSLLLAAFGVVLQGCGGSGNEGNAKDNTVAADAASAVYVPPGKHDELYSFLSGGFNG